MPVELNHTIVAVSDRKAAAEWVTEILGLEPPTSWGPFYGVDLANGVQLDFADGGSEPIRPTHYAFLISEPEFDEIYGRIVERGIEHWADPMQSRPGEINRNDGGRGVYFLGPDGHFLEVITRPYGSGA
jgi:catechol 2,3-dioxygenase-like lactoylglutathione lyase family enzyme